MFNIDSGWQDVEDAPVYSEEELARFKQKLEAMQVEEEGRWRPAVDGGEAASATQQQKAKFRQQAMDEAIAARIETQRLKAKPKQQNS